MPSPDPRAAETQTFDSVSLWRKMESGNRVRPSPYNHNLAFVRRVLTEISNGASITPRQDALAALAALERM